MCIDLLTLSIAFIISFFTANAGSYLISGILLCAEGIFLFFRNIRRSADLPEPISVFSLSWVLCLGISALKLSNLQKDWVPETWLCFYLIYVVFYLSSFFSKKKFSVSESRKIKEVSYKADVVWVIAVITAISAACFLVEVCILGYVPLFTSDTPHAYSYFHVSGLHYFTVLFVLEPSFFVYYLLNCRKDKMRNTLCILCTVISIVLPLLLVSRFQLLFGIFLAAFTFLIIKGRSVFNYINKRNILILAGGILLLVCCYVFLTIERAHSVQYLNGIFEMKDQNMPIFITQPYMYLANNFDNFNCLVEQLKEHTYGLRQLFPVFALTGLKFRFPSLVNFPLYVTKEELTTVTLFYDAYYDFGMPGCILFAGILGIVYAWIDHLRKIRRTPGTLIISAQLYCYLFLAFFTTWFSNPTTWFYLFISIAIELILCYVDKNKKRKEA